jgi:hypothetical protein
MAIDQLTLSSDLPCNGAMRAAVVLGILLICGAAAAAPQPTYVSPGKYRQYSCDQLLGVARNISAHGAALAGRKNGGDMASRDPVVTVPAVLQETGRETGELAKLRQELDSVEEAAIQGQCDIEFVGSK